MEESNLKTIRQWLEESEVFVLLTGAGMGADSGIPTYRGEDGSWGKIQNEFQRNITEVMNPEFMRENLLYMWNRFVKRIEFFKNNEPHTGYRLILKWFEQYAEDFFCLSSNIDGQLYKADFNPGKIFEIHGNIQYLQCSTPCQQNYWPYLKPENFMMEEEITLDDIPRCPYCHNFARPNVLLFNDKTFVRTRANEQKQKWEAFLETNKNKQILAIEIGAGIQVKNIRIKSLQLAREHKANIIRINPDYDQIEKPHIGIAQKALETILEIDSFLNDKI